MQKIVILILFVPFIAGCAAFKKSAVTKTIEKERNKISYQDIKKLNLSNNDFNIIKAEITIYSNEGKEKLLGNIKYQKGDTFLISLRNRSGIEGARVFITNDTILVNDRINKKLYVGRAKYLESKYGIKTEILPVIIGDFISDKMNEGIVECRKNMAYVKDIVNGKEIRYKVDCRKGKVIDISVNDSITKTKINIELKNFDTTNEYNIARNITLETDDQEERIEISIEKLVIGLEKDITFIPGRNYEKILLR